MQQNNIVIDKEIKHKKSKENDISPLFLLEFQFMTMLGL